MVLMKRRTQRQRGEVDGAAEGAVATFIPSSDLEGVDGAGDQRADRHRVGLAVHAHSAVHVRTLRDTTHGRSRLLHREPPRDVWASVSVNECTLS